ncbi:hypothetical protein LENED_005345 [Lentinula edodes]|uniref:Uncharacterized protein n=1 Tax=Lentinula edodes TaxID=5353 RepID=A0A1Q3E8R2_LENED|nr:hypothetical protein LENED_005345 [Lentinula edodes]
MDTDEPEEFSEEQLRRLYDEEEVSRFLHLFAAKSSFRNPRLWEHKTLQRPNFNPFEDKQTLSERIAFRYILPLLPPPPLPPPPFALGRLRLATQRCTVYLERSQKERKILHDFLGIVVLQPPSTYVLLPDLLRLDTALIRLTNNTRESQKETDVKRAVLLAMNDVADLHERIKNIFIWRRPASSKVYGTALCFCCILTLLLPAQYIAKLVYFLGGAFFWHIIPILAALPSEDRARIPPAFQDVPTDAEFAMEIISRRIAAGLDVNPSKRSSQKSRPSPVALGEIKTEDATSSSTPTTPGGSKPEKGKDVDWKKWGERAAIGKAWMVDKKLVSKKPDTSDISAAASQPTLLPDAPLPSGGTHTFPCQHTSSPGLLTFTQDMLFFNPIASTKTKVAIPLADIRAVKKTGLLKGLTVKWIDATNGEHKEEVFPWGSCVYTFVPSSFGLRKSNLISILLIRISSIHLLYTYLNHIAFKLSAHISKILL